MGSWDRGVEYEYILNKLIRLINTEKSNKNKCYASILLIQLVNGGRISEAVRGYKEYLKTGKTELRVRVSKKKQEDLRLMIIPNNVVKCYDVSEIGDKELRDRVIYYCRKKLKVNTHSLRYSFITYLLRNNVSPAIISKITHHAKLDLILHYTQQKTAEGLLRNIIDNVHMSID